MLENRYKSGTLGKEEMTVAIVQYDAAKATARSAGYMLWSVIIAAIAAIASALSAALSAYAVWSRK